jgi:16S rRNA processing protein RimM
VRARPELLGVGDAVTVAGRSLQVERRAGTDARPIVRLSGCSTRDAAERLRGEPLLVSRAAAPPLEEDEYWAEDLVGCTVIGAQRTVGTVRRLLAYPSCELLEVERAGGGGVALLVPLVRDAVRSVDVDARRIEIDLEFLGER